jgi:hypothetical protein
MVQNYDDSKAQGKKQHKDWSGAASWLPQPIVFAVFSVWRHCTLTACHYFINLLLRTALTSSTSILQAEDR